ncbi:MAG: hypothetical protein J6N52_12520 [Clostridia bacterium]|nr:hypothetical protein [Clostridia bacterium]
MLALTDKAQHFYAPQMIYADNGMGYIFLTENNVRVTRESRPSDSTYLNISIEHGAAPQEESYAYIMLPGSEYEETAALAAEPDVEIISMTDSLHAVRDLLNGKVFANVFEPAELDGISVLTPCSIMYQYDEALKTYELTVSEPSADLDFVILEFGGSVSAEPQTDILTEENRVTIDFRSDKTEMKKLRVALR